MSNQERFLTLVSRRYSIDGGRVTLLEVECPELEFGMGIDVNKRPSARLIDDFMQAINEGIAEYAARDFVDLEGQPELV